MEDVRVGLVVRAIRRRRGWRQLDLANAAGVSQQTVSRIETGRLAEMTLGSIRRVAASVQIGVGLEVRWRGPELAALLDERHSRIVDLIVRRLADLGWQTFIEYTFNVSGERGAVDVLAWHASSDALLVVEVKTRLVDLQEMLSTLDRKSRVVRATVPERFGWRPAAMGLVLALADDPALRGAVSRRPGVFASALPARTVEVRRWLANPDGALRGLWFLSDTRPGSGIKKRGGSQRVRRPRMALSPSSDAQASPIPAVKRGPAASATPPVLR